MTDEEEFEEVWKDKHWAGFELGRKLYNTDPRIIEMIKQITLFYWLEKGKRDREQVRAAIWEVLTYTLPYLAEKRLRELLEEMG